MSTTVPFDCPRCGTVLTMADRQGIEIDYCPTCRGIWLDRGELDKILERSVEAAPAPQAGFAPPPQPAAGGAAPQQAAGGWSQPPMPQPGYGSHGSGHGGGHGRGQGSSHGGHGGGQGSSHGGYGGKRSWLHRILD